MKKVYATPLPLILLFLFFFTQSAIHAQVDLELSVTQTEQAPDAWTKYSIIASLSNNGPATANGIEVAISKPAGSVYQGGNEYSATAGTFHPYNDSKGWTIPSLGANATATLTINVFTLGGDAVNPVYAQVATASPQDVDSTPGNGVAPIVAEDDEGYSGQSQNTNPDLQLADIQMANSGDPGDNVSYTLDLVNAGNAVAAGDYTIEVYLSQSAGQTSGTLVGEINTGNTAIGTINDVNGAISIPSNFAAGNWYAVFYVDAGNDISESNESNNIVSIPFEVKDNEEPSGDFCGFEKSYFDMPEFLFNPRPTIGQSAQEANGNYVFNVRNGNGQVGFNNVELVIDDQGDQVSINENAPSVPNPDNQLADGSTYTAEKNGTSISVQVTAANGNIIFDKTYSNLVSSNRANSSDPKLILGNNGYYLYGAWIESDSPNPTNLYLAQLNAAGNLQGFTETEYSSDATSLDVEAVAAHPNGGILLSVRSFTYSNIALVRMNLQGINWNSLVIGDLVTNRATNAQFNASENAIYLLLFFNNEQHVRKINAWTGNTVWTTKLADEFNPNSTSIRFFNLANSLVLTEDGGVATGYVFRGIFDTEFQTEIGKLDRNGNGVWWRQFDWAEVNILEAMFETSDGGIIFAGRDADNYVVYKLNENGQPTPSCSNEPPTGEGDIDLALTYTVSNANPSQWSFFTTSLRISNTGAETATGVVVNVDLPAGVVPQGGNEYSSTQGNFAPYGSGNWTVGSLAAGATAILQVNYFLKSGGPIDFYAQVIAANEEDGDSTPNNGTVGSPNEDDEAGISINNSGAAQSKIVGGSAAYGVDRLLQLYPNPVLTGAVNLVIDSKQARATSLEVYNGQGQLVKTEVIDMVEGTNQLSFGVDGFVSGMYFLMVRSDGGKVMSGKFFVERK